MKRNLDLARIIALYLSKFDESAVRELGCSTWTQCYSTVKDALGVGENTVKNMRDTFDPYHDNPRVGWLRSLTGCNLRAFELFQDLSFDAFTALVDDILVSPYGEGSIRLLDLVSETREVQDDRSNASIYAARGKTGRQAEQYFIQCFKDGLLPWKGDLLDRRDDGCGYDFLIAGPTKILVEVKGLAGTGGGILLTDKEWQTAQKVNGYTLFIAYNLRSESSEPAWEIIEDPARYLQPIRSVTTVVQTNWQIPHALRDFIN